MSAKADTAIQILAEGPMDLSNLRTRLGMASAAAFEKLLVELAPRIYRRGGGQVRLRCESRPYNERARASMRRANAIRLAYNAGPKDQP